MQRIACLLLAGALAAVACGGSGGVAPETVAGEFWEAIRARDLDAAREHTHAASELPLERMRDGRPIDEVLIGEALVGEHAAVVRTSLGTRVNERLIHTAFDTHLVRSDDGWRVDVDATERELAAALFASSMQQIGEAVGQGVQQFSEALEQGAAEVSRAIRDALEEFEQEREQP